MNRPFKGLLYLHEAFYVAAVEACSALQRDYANLAARRAYESMERSVKAVHLLVGDEPPKSHTPGLPRDLDGRIPIVAWVAREDPRKGVAILLTKPAPPEFQVRVFKYVRGTATLLQTAWAPAPGPMELALDGSTIFLRVGGADVTALTDTSSYHPLTQGQWEQSVISENKMQQIRHAMKQVGKSRNKALYSDREFAADEARALVEAALSIFKSVLGGVGRKSNGGA